MEHGGILFSLCWNAITELLIKCVEIEPVSSCVWNSLFYFFVMCLLDIWSNNWIGFGDSTINHKRKHLLNRIILSLIKIERFSGWCVVTVVWWIKEQRELPLCCSWTGVFLCCSFPGAQGRFKLPNSILLLPDYGMKNLISCDSVFLNFKH